MVNQLMGLGISPLAIELANRSLPLAGGLHHFIRNWEKITHDSWVLEAVQGYRVPLPALPFKSLKSLSSGGRPLAERDPEYAREACHRGDHTKRTGFPVNHLSSSPIKWSSKAPLKFGVRSFELAGRLNLNLALGPCLTLH